MIQKRDLDTEMLALIRRVARNLARGDSHLAEDLEQETILTALSSGPRDPRFMEPWLRRVVWNRLFTYRARQTRARRQEQAVGEHQKSSGTSSGTSRLGDPAVACENDELKAELQKRLRSLPEIYRVAVDRRVLQGVPPRLVAEELDIPVETVRTRVRRGLELLRVDIGGEERWAGLRAAWAAIPFFRGRRLTAALGLVTAAGLAVAIQPAASDPEPKGIMGEPFRSSDQVERTLSLASTPPVREVLGGPRVSRVVSVPDQGDAVDTSLQEYTVEVSGVAGQAAPNVEVFGRWGFGLAGVKRLGVTDQDGLLSIRVPVEGCWLAARGAPGELSEGVFLDQPGITSNGRVLLRLQERELAWIQVLGADAERGAEADPLAVQLWPDDVRRSIDLDPESGLTGPAIWVPGWRGEGQSYGVTWNETGKSVVICRGDEQLWWGPVIRRGQRPPEAIDVRDAWAVTGRVVTSDGQPVEGYSVYVPAQLSAAGRRQGQSTESGPDGRFRVGAIVGASTNVTIGRDVQIRAVEPSTGSGLRVVDLGDIDMGRLNVDRGSSVQVTGFEGPVQVSAVHKDEAQLWGAYRLAYPHCREIQAVEPSTASGIVRIPASYLDLASVIATGTDPDSGETVRLFSRKPKPGAHANRLRLEGPLPAVSHVTLRSPMPTREGRLLLVERRSGFRRAVAVPAETTDGSGQGPVLTLPISAGLWDVFFQCGDGRVLTRRRVQIAEGETVDFGEFSGEAGTLCMDFSNVTECGDPYDPVALRVTHGSELVAAEVVERAQLAELWGKQELTPGEYRVSAKVDGQVFCGFARVLDKRVATITLQADVIVLDVRLRMARKQPGCPAGTLKIIDPAGEVLVQTAIESDLTKRGVRLLAPELPSFRVTGEFDGISLEGVYTEGKQVGYGLVAIRKKRARTGR